MKRVISSEWLYGKIGGFVKSEFYDSIFDAWNDPQRLRADLDSLERHRRYDFE